MADERHYKIILDLPSEQPALGFREYAQAFSDIIEQSRPQFAIGIFGGWGSGKTTLMQAIKAQLNRDSVIPVWFSAWRYEKEEHLIVPLLDEVRESLMIWADQHRDMEDVARKTAATVGKTIRSLLAGFSFTIGVPGALDLTLDANKALSEAEKLGEEELNAQLPKSFYHASFRALSAAFDEFAAADTGRRIVVFIDDLDRCLPEGALEVLESMKLFFDLQGFVFVVGLDQSVVEWLIDLKYGRMVSAGAEKALSSYHIRGSDYIKKIFQVPIALPPVSTRQLREFLDSLFNEAELTMQQRTEINDRLEPHLRHVVTDSGVNPREIKRYINAYTLSIKVKPYLNRDTVLALQTLAFRSDWQPVREALYSYRELFLDGLNRYLEGETMALENLDSQLAAIPQSFLAYIAPNGPGHQVLSTDNLDEYIYASEATQSTQNPQLLDALRTVGQMKQALSELRQLVPGINPPDAKERISSLSSLTSAALGRVENSAKGPIAPIILADLNTLKERVRNIPDFGYAVPGVEESFDSEKFWQQLLEWIKEQRSLIDEIQSNLLALYRYSSLSPA